MSSPATHDPPQALNEIELRAVAGQPIQLELRLGAEHWRQALGLRPWRIIKGQDHRFAQRGWRGPRDVPQRGEKGLLQPGRFRTPVRAEALAGLSSTRVV